MPSRRDRLRAGGFAAAVLGCLLAWSCAAPRGEAPTVPVEGAPRQRDGKVAVGERFFDFVSVDLDGRSVRLSEVVGTKTVLLQFWGIRCAPCLAEMEFLSGLQQRLGPRGLQVLGVNTDPVDGAQLREALAARGLKPNYANVLDPDYSIATRYTQWLIPVSVLIGRDGIVKAVHTGYKPEMDGAIEAEVEALLAD